MLGKEKVNSLKLSDLYKTNNVTVETIPQTT
jgi:hypothetical protein